MSDLIRREDALRVTLAYSSSYSAEQAETAIRALTAVQPDAREAALRDIARQKKTDEMDTEYDVEYADFEGGYNAIIDVARRALPAVQPVMESGHWKDHCRTNNGPDICDEPCRKCLAKPPFSHSAVQPDAHVNETPKSEHEAAVMLTPATKGERDD